MRLSVLDLLDEDDVALAGRLNLASFTLRESLQISQRVRRCLPPGMLALTSPAIPEDASYTLLQSYMTSIPAVMRYLSFATIVLALLRTV